LKELYAVAMQDFTGGNLTSQGTITQDDINLLSDKMISHIDQQKKNIVIQNFDIDDGILLAFSDTIFSEVKNIDVPYQT